MEVPCGCVRECVSMGIDMRECECVWEESVYAIVFVLVCGRGAC